MNEGNLVKRLSFLTPGDGYRKCVPLKLLSDIRDATGLVLAAATVPAVAALETNFDGLSVVTGQTFMGEFQWVVPQDYDSSIDELRIRVACNMSGATNSGETITVVMYNKRPIPSVILDDQAAFPAALALSADLGVPTSVDTIPAGITQVLTKWVEVNADYWTDFTKRTANRSLAATADASIKPGDCLQIQLNLSAAHATDACYVYGIELWYRSNLAFTDIRSR